MPSHRKRSTPQPTRRPQVAGLRKPASKPTSQPQPQPRPRPTPYSAQHVDETKGDEQAADEQAADEQAADQQAADEQAARPRPVPRAKDRDAGQVKPEAGVVSDEFAEPSESPAEPPAPSGGGVGADKAFVSIVAVLALVFALAAGFFAYKLIDVYSATSNQAISDAVGTEGVQKDVTSAVETLLSYDYNKIDEHEQAARSLLVTDEVRDEFDKLYGDVKEKAPKQKIVLVTKVSYSSVLELDGDTAKVLLFVEQSASREGTEQRSSGGGQLTVDAQRQDGKWRLAGINTYGPIQPPAGDDKKDDN